MLTVLFTFPRQILFVVRPELQVRNEPKNIRIAAEYVSKIKGVSLEKVIEVTTQNALRLFPKLKSAIRPWRTRYSWFHQRDVLNESNNPVLE